MHHVAMKTISWDLDEQKSDTAFDLYQIWVLNIWQNSSKTYFRFVSEQDFVILRQK